MLAELHGAGRSIIRGLPDQFPPGPSPSSQTLKSLPRWMGGRMCSFYLGDRSRIRRDPLERPPTTNQRSEELGPSEVSEAAPPPPTAPKDDEASVSRPYTPLANNCLHLHHNCLPSHAVILLLSAPRSPCDDPRPGR